MAFGWREFGQGVANAGQVVSSLLMADYERKQNIKDQWDMWQKQRDITEQFEMKMTDHRARLQEEMMNKQADLKTQIDAFGSRETMNFYTEAMQSGNMFRQMQAQAMVDSIQRLERGEELSDAQWQGVEQYNPQARIHISKLQGELKESQMKLGQTEALTNLYKQTTQESKARTEKLSAAAQGGQIRFEDAVKNYDLISKQIEKIMSSDGWIMLSGQVRESGEDWMNKLDPKTVENYLRLDRQLKDFQRIQAVYKSVMQGYVPGLFDERGRELPPPEEEEQAGVSLDPLKYETYRPSGKLETGIVAKPMQEVMGELYKAGKKAPGAIKKEFGRSRLLTNIKKLRKKHNIPKNIKIYTGDDVERLKKAGEEYYKEHGTDLRVIIYLEHPLHPDTLLWTLGRPKKVLGLVPYGG